jgi:hypothetical protein
MRIEVFVVDRVEGRTVVLQDDEGRDHRVPVGAVPPTATEGSVLRVSVDDRGDAQWETAEVDGDETARRRAAAQARIDELRDRG